jgi:hypothetical protein
LPPQNLFIIICSIEAEVLPIQAFRIGDPAQASGGDSGDAVGNAVLLAQFF